MEKNIFKNQKLKSSTRIFLFWLCSIIDQFYPYVKIWTDGEKAMLNILKNKPKTFSDVKKLMQNIKTDSRGNIIAEIPTGEKTFKLVRDDYLRLKNTFNYLSTYNQIQKHGQTTITLTQSILERKQQ